MALSLEFVAVASQDPAACRVPRPVVSPVGKGSVLMSGLELAVTVRERLPLTVILFNDGY